MCATSIMKINRQQLKQILPTQVGFFKAVKLAQSIRHLLLVREVASLSPISTNALLQLSVLDIPLDKELTANCLVETCMKLKELIPVVMVKYSMNRVQLPL